MGEEKMRKGLLIKTWDRCRSMGRERRLTGATGPLTSPTKAKRDVKCRVAPEGCFSVYVGPERERYVIKTEYLNHPLFRILLEEAETEYGFATEGPLELPCKVGIFESVLWEMEQEELAPPGCNNGGFQLLSPSRSAIFCFTPPRHAAMRRYRSL